MLILGFYSLFAQYGGNSIIDQSYSSSKQQMFRTTLSDTTFLIQANVLMNVSADSYVITFGLSESSKTLKEANQKIDKRIDDFIAALEKEGVKSEDIFIDITTQTRLADYKIEGNNAEQYISGYEQKKNVVFKLNDISKLDKIIILASELNIYDLAKVDYIISDPGKIYNQMFKEAVEIINKKKELYLSATNLKLMPSSVVYGETFYCYPPSQLYRSYTPTVSSEVIYDYDSKMRKKELAKNTTYFYDKINYSSFDKILNPVIIAPSIEYVFNLIIKFEIENN